MERDRLREKIAVRAAFRCEYCRIPETEWFRHHLDKGTDYFDPDGHGKAVRLFNPRLQEWNRHFHLESALVVPLTQEGEATVRVLKITKPLA